jgi:hemoglobin
MNVQKWMRGCVAGLACAAAVGAGCSLGNDTSEGVASSGDPEADQRADQRMGTDQESGKGGQKAATLFERVGGEEGIARLVDDVVERSIADPRVNFERQGVKTGIFRESKEWTATPERIETLKKHFREFLTLAAGGPAEYTGREMGEVHKGMKITNAEFDAMIGDVKASMDRLGWGTREKRDMLAVFETTRKQIVEK